MPPASRPAAFLLLCRKLSRVSIFADLEMNDK